MASPYAMFETEETLEQQGIIVDYGDFRVRLAHAGGSNKKFKNLLSARLQPYERQLAIGTMDDGVAAQILREVYADTIILMFEVKVVTKGKDKNDPDVITYVPGVPNKKGAAGPFNRENVIRICTEIPRLFQDLKMQAENFALYRKIEQDEETKN